MPDLVINTGPVIGLTVALGDLNVLESLYREILITREVFEELEAGGKDSPEIKAIKKATCIRVACEYQKIPFLLSSELDKGEASVIQAATQHKVSVVAIDEKQGRRIARLHGIKVTGSVGILVKAKRIGCISDLEICFDRMQSHGVWISRAILEQALSK